ncbi:hypothetical protein D9Q98_008182 [Chlorella vulgaris]|uniref:Uncharacterized protein n=1 Tax=Chlorella vulgaris TaxID=3077 RepID=A0A9D4YTB2_CHLVU|nr:hypothetical protein D9Q98_008182 [Chlorella vulgaris]
MEQSHEDRHASQIQQQVSELESLVSLTCSKGVDVARCRDVIEDAVRRARRKGAMLSHLDSGLLLSTLEQAKSEVASLPDVTATNAAVMRQELLHHQDQNEQAEHVPCSSSEEVAGTSQQSLADPSAAGTSGSLPSGTEETDTSSLGAASGSSPGARHRRKASATPSATASAAAEAIAPMRDLASDVAAEAAAEADEDRFFRRTLLMKASKSGDFRVAKAYDFDAAQSPRAAYHTRDAPFLASPPPSPEDASPNRVGPPMWVAPQGDEEQEDLLVHSHSLSSKGARAPDDERDEKKAELDVPAPISPASSGTPRHRLSRLSGGGPSPFLSCSSLPPGMSPMAVAEGGVGHDDTPAETISPHSPTGIGEVDLHSYTEAPFTLHTVTPPHHVMAALALEMQGHLRL